MDIFKLIGIVGTDRKAARVEVKPVGSRLAARFNLGFQLQHAWVDEIDSKNGSAIAVPLNSLEMEVLLRQKGKHDTRVFTYAGKPIANANTKEWKKTLLRAGITDFRWHDLRHTWATWQRKAGASTHELQSLGGWKTGAMVERYAHLDADHLKVAANRIDSVFASYDSATL